MIDLIFLQTASERGTEWPEAIIATAAIVGVFSLVTVVVTVAIWQGLGVWRARMSVAREDAYRELAERVTAAQERTASTAETVAAELAELRARTAEMERMLKEVE